MTGVGVFLEVLLDWRRMAVPEAQAVESENCPGLYWCCRAAQRSQTLGQQGSNLQSLILAQAMGSLW